RQRDAGPGDELPGQRIGSAPAGKQHDAQPVAARTTVGSHGSLCLRRNIMGTDAPSPHVQGMTLARLGAVLLLAALLIVAFLLAGARGLAYVILYAAAVLPGLPIGRALFGRTPPGFLAGAVIGYGL